MFAIPQSIPEIITTLGDRLRIARIALNWTQDEVARRANISKQTVLRIETGKNSSLENLLKVAQALGKLREAEELFVPRPTSIAEMATRSKTKYRQRSRPPIRKR